MNKILKFVRIMKISCLLFFSTIYIVFATGSYVQTVADNESNPVPQQQLTVTGTVIDEAGEPIPGVTVAVAETTIGVLTSINGTYTINVPSNTSVLRFSFVGYNTHEITVGNQRVINITLAEESQLLDEVVVVGYGVAKKESLTSAISVIKSEDIVSTKQVDVMATLRENPGLLITQKSSTPGAFDNQVSLRGYGDPIVVVDGVVRTATAKDSQWNYEWTSGSIYLAQ